MTLVALLAVTTGAWAEDGTLLVTITPDGSGNPVYSVDGIATLDKGVAVFNKSKACWTKGDPQTSLTVTVAEGINVTKVKFNCYGGNSWEDKEAPYQVFLYNFSTYSHAERIGIISEYGVTSIEVYGTAPSAASTVEVAWNKTSKIGTFDMPGGNVELEPDYFAQAEFAMSTGETPVALAPAAIAGVPANTDDPIVTAGTVANIGTSEVKQGTLMYFVSQSTGNTAPEAPDYDTDGWSENVPTAKGLQEGDVYVWYYIKGAEPDNIADRTDDNTRNDSDIKPLGTTGFVTLGAEPTYTVSLNKTDLAEGEPAKWSAKSTNVTTEVNLGTGDLEGVMRGETVTATYSGEKKVKSVKAVKKKAYEHSITIAVDFHTSGQIATAPAMTIEFNTGETWADVAARYDWLDTYLTYTVFYKDNTLNGDVHDANGGVTPDQTIDPNGSYYWGFE